MTQSFDLAIVGADFVIATVADLIPAPDIIERRLAAGLRPGAPT